MDTNKLYITFCSGAGTVTGANFLLEGAGKKFLIDCGLVQGSKLADDDNWKEFPYDPKEIDALFVSHAHIDHIGRIPKLYYEGFRGKIYSTEATRDLTEIMLEDTVGILSKNIQDGLDKIYTVDCVKKIMELWEGVPYHRPINHPNGFMFSYKDAGHILGSGMLEVSYKSKKLVFTGDLGNSPSPILLDTEPVIDADYIVMESVYGDRNHEDRENRRKRLEEIIEDNYRRKGTLIIPTFSLERTQELLFEMDMLVEHQRVPQMPIFLDSPLAIRLTKVFRKYKQYFNKAAQEIIAGGDDIFSFPGLKSTLKAEDSKMILNVPDPKIIMAGSGMSNGGRIIHHEHNYLPNPNNTILLVGYQSPGTMGRLIDDGAESVYIRGQEVPVRAHIAKISGYSGHKDSDGLLNFVQDASGVLKRVFMAMGEPKSSMFLAQRVRDSLGVDAYVPRDGERIELDF